MRLTPIVSVQNRYSPADRSSEAIVDRCESESLAFLPWGPVEQGAIRGDAAVGQVAKARGATAHQVALAWLLARSPVMLPIPGTGSVAHVEENMQAESLRTSPEEVAELTAA
jgi:pyridoxine 4-dehydrogenase